MIESSYVVIPRYVENTLMSVSYQPANLQSIVGRLLNSLSFLYILSDLPCHPRVYPTCLLCTILLQIDT